MTDLAGQMMSEDEFIEHFGIKGMKWGKRKAPVTNPTHVSADAARFNKINSRLSKNGVDNLSNDDLAKLNKRNQLLSEYKKNNPTKFEKGVKSTQKAMDNLKTAGKIITAVGAVVGAGVVLTKGAKALGGNATAKDVAKLAQVGGKAVLKVLSGL